MDEFAAELFVRTGVKYLPGRCHAMLKERGYTLKVMRQVAAQRDEAQRDEYWQAIAELYAVGATAASFCFCDETAKVESALRRMRGWGMRGSRVESRHLLHHHQHISVLALYGLTGFIDFDHIEGGYNAEDFMEAVEFMIIPHLQAFPGPNSVLILDNCRYSPPLP